MNTTILLLRLLQPEEDLLERARQALESRRAEEAIRLVERYLASPAPLSEELSSGAREQLEAAHLLRGSAYETLGAAGKAADDFARAVAIDPDDPGARMRLGRIRLRQGRLREAREELAFVAGRDPAHAEAHHLLGVVHLDRSREPGANREAELAEARRALERALALRPRHPPTIAILTVALDELRLFSESERVLASALDALAPALVKDLGLIYSRLANYDRAARAFERLPPDGEEAPWRAVQLGICYRETRQYDRARDSLREALALAPGNGTARLLLGSVLFQLGEIEDARSSLEKALEEAAPGARTHLELARVFAALGEREAAIAHCLEAIALEPEREEAHYQLGQLLAQEGRAGEASEAFESFEALKKLSEEVLRYEGRVGHYTDDVPSLLELARLYRGQGRADKAADTLRRAGRIDPDRAAIPLAMADLLVEQGLYADALEFSRQALSLEPRSPEALFQASLIHRARNDLEQAERSLRKLLEVDPGHARGWNDLGVLLERAGRYPDAIAAFESAVAADPDFALAYNGLGVALFERGNYAGSAAHFEKVVELSPDYAQARLNLAEAYRRLGRQADAASQMREYERLRSLTASAPR